MDNEIVDRVLIEFFLESFQEDAAGVGDWFAQGGHDIDQFYAAVIRRQNKLQDKS